MLRTLKIVLLSGSTLGAMVLAAHAQSSRPQFEVASVKPNKSVSVGGAYSNFGQRGGHVTITKFSLRMLMGQAYPLPTLSDASIELLDYQHGLIQSTLTSKHKRKAIQEHHRASDAAIAPRRSL
jgi:hypothetical protein